jgi:hypothetical protein
MNGHLASGEICGVTMRISPLRAPQQRLRNGRDWQYLTQACPRNRRCVTARTTGRENGERLGRKVGDDVLVEHSDLRSAVEFHQLGRLRNLDL